MHYLMHAVTHTDRFRIFEFHAFSLVEVLQVGHIGERISKPSTWLGVWKLLGYLQIVLDSLNFGQPMHEPARLNALRAMIV